ncbi:MAG TPA: hypothetical protein VN847_20660 [Streptosporangiaceae bacterium]|nr:hypothetical protein [Streptosporangiaceae bacterium]
MSGVDKWINLTALWQIVVVGLLAGAGLPALFAVGLRFLNMTGGARVATAGAGGGPGPDGHHHAVAGHENEETVYGGNSMGLVVACVCFAIILAAIGYGIYLIVSGA